MKQKTTSQSLQLLKPKDSEDPDKAPHGRKTQMAAVDDEDKEEE